MAAGDERCLCCAAHGLSCLITTRTPSSQQTLLFDKGPDETIFERNVSGVDIGGVDAMMLSHGHWDRAGAMPRALRMMTPANGGVGDELDIGMVAFRL